MICEYPSRTSLPLPRFVAKMTSPDEARPHDPAGAVIAQGGESGGYCGDVSTMHVGTIRA